MYTIDKSESFWDKSAKGYDKEEMKDRDGRVKILEKTKKYLHKEDCVLDFGCATGLLASEIADHVKMVYGMDISSKMINIARDKANKENIQNVVYTHTTIFDKSYKKEDFDVILGMYVLHLVEDIPNVLKRIYELLKPGGLFISVTPCLGKRSLMGMSLSLISKIGLIPNLRIYNLSELEKLINNTEFKILKTECIRRRGRQYFIIAQKK